MNRIFKKLLSPHRLEYIILDSELVILEISPCAKRFADRPDEVEIGKDARLGFPELVGAEKILKSIINQQQDSFELKGIARFISKNQPFYLDLYAFDYQADSPLLPDGLILLLEDVTEVMLLKQSLVQRANEAELLLSRLTHIQNYNQKIIDGMHNALFVTNSSGIIKFTNKATRQVLGYESSELIGRSLSEIIGDRNLLTNLNPEAWDDQESFRSFETWCQTQSGEEIVLEFACSTIPAEIPGTQDLIYIGWNITERKQAEAEIRKALAKEREISELRYRFISLVSHEFRTPLTTILSSAELLEYYSRENVEESRKRHLSLIQQAANTIRYMLDDILVLEKAEIGKLTFKPAPLNLDNFCEIITQEIQIINPEQSRIVFRSSGTCQFAIMDENLLRQILINLLSNALKYSSSTENVLLTLTCQNNQAIFEIQDQGLGIPPEDQPYIFDSFHRGRNVGEIEGTGMGLSIVKKAVDLHQGNINFSSTLGIGTTFQVTLPLRSEVSVNFIPSE